MNGVESPTNAEAMVRALGVSQHLSLPADASSKAELTRNNLCAKGFVTTAKDMLTRALTGVGFVHIAAGAAANFSALVGRSPTEGAEAMPDLKPGLAAELASWAATQIASNGDTAQDTQAHVDPQRAVALLS